MNCTAEAGSAFGSNSVTAIIILALSILNTLLTLAAPYILKTRPVQEIIHPRRVEKKKELRESMKKLMEATNEAIRTMNMSMSNSSRSDSEKLDRAAT
jgi:uncharacterized membrane protein